MKQKNIMAIALLGSLLLNCGMAKAWMITVSNKSFSKVNVYIDQQLCGPIGMEVFAGDTKSIDSGICCSKSVTITALDGPAKGNSTVFYPQKTGLVEACAHYAFTVTQTPNNQLVANPGLQP